MYRKGMIYAARGRCRAAERLLLGALILYHSDRYSISLNASSFADSLKSQLNGTISLINHLERLADWYETHQLWDEAWTCRTVVLTESVLAFPPSGERVRFCTLRLTKLLYCTKKVDELRDILQGVLQAQDEERPTPSLARLTTLSVLSITYWELFDEKNSAEVCERALREKHALDGQNGEPVDQSILSPSLFLLLSSFVNAPETHAIRDLFAWLDERGLLKGRMNGVFWGVSGVARHHERRGKFGPAAHLYEVAVEYSERIGAEGEDRVALALYGFRTMFFKDNLSKLYIRLNRRANARELLANAIKNDSSFVSPKSLHDFRVRLAWLHKQEKQWAEAAAVYREDIHALETHEIQDYRELRRIKGYLAKCLIDEAKAGQSGPGTEEEVESVARSRAKESISLLLGMLESYGTRKVTPVDIGQIIEDLTWAYRTLKLEDPTEEAYKKAAQLLGTSQANENLADLYVRRGRLAEAIPLLSCSLQDLIWQRANNDDKNHDDRIVAVAHKLVWVYSRLSRLDEATAVCHQVILVNGCLRTRQRLGQILLNTKKWREAISVLIALFQVTKNVPERTLDARDAIRNLAYACLELSQTEEEGGKDKETLNSSYTPSMRLVEDMLDGDRAATLEFREAVAHGYLTRWDAVKAATIFVDVLDECGKQTGYRKIDWNTRYEMQGLQMAQDMYEAAISRPGVDAPILWSKRRLAKIYHEQGKTKEAAKLRDDVFQHTETREDCQHSPALSAIRRSLGTDYYNCGEWERAEIIFRWMIEAEETSKGADDLAILSLQSRLARILRETGRHDEAIALLVHVVEQLECEHPTAHSTLRSARVRLSSTFMDIDLCEQSAAVFEKVLATDEAILGAQHETTMDTMRHLANTYYRGANKDKAECLLQDSLATKVATLGPSHKATLAAHLALAELYFAEDRDYEAASIYAVLRPEQIRVGRFQSNLTLRSISYLSALLLDDSLPEDMRLKLVSFTEELLQQLRDELPADHPVAQDISDSICKYYREHRKLESLTNMILMVLAWREKDLGQSHPLTMWSLKQAGWSLERAGEHEGARELFKRLVQVSTDSLGANHSDTITAAKLLERVEAGRLDDNHGFHPFMPLPVKHKRFQEEEGEESEHVDLSNPSEDRETALNQAELQAQRALYRKEIQLGALHPETLTIAYQLGVLYHSHGKADEAEAMYTRALEGRRRSLGERDHAVLMVMNSLAELMTSVRSIQRAEELYRHILSCTPEDLDLDDPVALAATNGLSQVISRNKGPDAEISFYEDCVRSRKEHLGPRHYATLEILFKLAELSSSRGHFESARGHFIELVESQEAQWGAGHPTVLAAIRQLSLLYRKNSMEAEEVELFEKVSFAREQSLEADHPYTLDAYHQLGVLLARRHDGSRAEAMYRWALRGREHILGMDHPSTLESLSRLRSLLVDLGNEDAVDELLGKVREKRHQQLGPTHPLSLKIDHELAVRLVKTDPGTAQSILQQTLLAKEEVLGMDHTSTLDTLHVLEGLLSDRDEDRTLHQQRLALAREEKLGRDHTLTRRAMSRAGISAFRADRNEEAASFLERSMNDNPEIHRRSDAYDIYALAWCYTHLGKVPQAGVLLLKALRQLPSITDPVVKAYAEVRLLMQLAQVYERQQAYEATVSTYAKILDALDDRLVEEKNPGARLNTLRALSSVHRSHRSWSDAIATGEQALRLAEDVKGKEHPVTLEQLEMLCELYDLSGNRRKSQELRKELDRRRPAPEKQSFFKRFSRTSD